MRPRHRDWRFLLCVALTVAAALAAASYLDGWFHEVWLYARPVNDHGFSLIREPGWLMVIHEFGMGTVMQATGAGQMPPRFAFYYEPTNGFPTTVAAFQAATLDLGVLKLHLEASRGGMGADSLFARHELVTALALTAAGAAWLLYRRSILRRRAAENRCLHCGYDLRGQGETTTACPECGKPPHPIESGVTR